jgi:hypothetical protein
MQSKTQGCGCGGRGGGYGSGCGCGCGAKAAPPAAVACSPCETASFVRPRFFAGQLLTEDDLGALVDYMLAKQRFHNTRLFGKGVVCGLAIERVPSDDARIVVEAGHAIDGCGNDLVLTCARTLDLAPLIRELQARQRSGSDCTDPCPPPASQPADAPHRQYCLYARYSERPDQPVAAYPVGDDCDASTTPSCEPTRILEGITFELRCPPPAPPAETMADRLAECDGQGGDPTELAAEARQRSVRDCQCAAINPPCPTSTDDAVLLACIEVDRCKVVQICNTLRHHVFAPATLRYWGSIQPPSSAGCCGAIVEDGGNDEVKPRADAAKELAELKRGYAALERRLAELEQTAPPRKRQP